MKTDTKILGNIEVDKDSVINFAGGLLGLEDYKKYALIALPDNDKFLCLQSMEDAGLAFFVINPWDFFPDYEIDIPDGEIADVGIGQPEQARVYCILTVSGEIKDITANLLAPIVINCDKNRGKQVVLAESKYNTKHRLFQ